ncbi:hypothetical protein Syun_000565 [Stephania yunnanensis]|uniref:Uncharacterized protein n=1 Tax=Stephania yunnanensis TaxID=152371 RepID=A0AAP0LD93_9MAGN
MRGSHKLQIMTFKLVQHREQKARVVTLVSVNDTFTLSPSPLSTPTTTAPAPPRYYSPEFPDPKIGGVEDELTISARHRPWWRRTGTGRRKHRARDPQEGTEAGDGEGDVFDDLVDDGRLFFPDGVGVGEKGVEGEEELSHRLPPFPLRQLVPLAGIEAGGGAGGADGSKGGHAGVGGPVARSHREQEKERKRMEEEKRERRENFGFYLNRFFLLEPIGSLNRLLMTRIAMWRHVAIDFRHVINNMTGLPKGLNLHYMQS